MSSNAEGGSSKNLLLQSIKIRNAALPGSLLKVWEGTLDVGGTSSSKSGGEFLGGSSSNNGHAQTNTIEC